LFSSAHVSTFSALADKPDDDSEDPTPASSRTSQPRAATLLKQLVAAVQPNPQVVQLKFDMFAWEKEQSERRLKLDEEMVQLKRMELEARMLEARARLAESEAKKLKLQSRLLADGDS